MELHLLDETGQALRYAAVKAGSGSRRQRMDSAEESADMPGTVGIALCHMAAADAETPAARLIKLVEPHLAAL